MTKFVTFPARCQGPGQHWQETVVWSASGAKQSVSFTSEFAGTGKHAGDTGLQNLYLDYAIPAS